MLDSSHSSNAPIGITFPARRAVADALHLAASRVVTAILPAGPAEDQTCSLSASSPFSYALRRDEAGHSSRASRLLLAQPRPLADAAGRERRDAELAEHVEA